MEVMSHPATPGVLERRRVYRDTEDRFLAGVASGVAQHLGVRVTLVRVAFLVMVLWSGFGVLLYAALWALVPLRDPTVDTSAPGLASASRRGLRPGRSFRRRDVGLAASLGAIALGGIVLLQALGLWVRPHVFWPLLVAAVGMALLWRQADESERQEWLSTSDGWRSWVRVIAGILLLLAALGIGLFQAGASGGRLSVTDVLIAVLLAMLGVGLVLGPWALRLNHDLRRERTERIRTQERADVAAHLHDSVLQTLALIQRQASDPVTVSQLARTQERELRTWLFENPSSPDETVKAALQHAIIEVEVAHHVPIELVVRGRLPDRAGHGCCRRRGARGDGQRRQALRRAADRRVRRGDRAGARGLRPRPRAWLRPRRGARGQTRRTPLDPGPDTRHGGRAEVVSDRDSGTEVRLFMPVSPLAPQGG